MPFPTPFLKEKQWGSPHSTTPLTRDIIMDSHTKEAILEKFIRIHQLLNTMEILTFEHVPTQKRVADLWYEITIKMNNIVINAELNQLQKMILDTLKPKTIQTTIPEFAWSPIFNHES